MELFVKWLHEALRLHTLVEEERKNFDHPYLSFEQVYDKNDEFYKYSNLSAFEEACKAARSALMDVMKGVTEHED